MSVQPAAPGKPALLVALALAGFAASGCMVREERVVQPAPSTAVVAPAPSDVVYTDTVPATVPAKTTTTVYSR